MTLFWYSKLSRLSSGAWKYFRWPCSCAAFDQTHLQNYGSIYRISSSSLYILWIQIQWTWGYGQVWTTGDSAHAGTYLTNTSTARQREKRLIEEKNRSQPNPRKLNSFVTWINWKKIQPRWQTIQNSNYHNHITTKTK